MVQPANNKRGRFLHALRPWWDLVVGNCCARGSATSCYRVNYMAQGSYSKDGIEFTSTCSIVLSGNIKTDVENRCPLWDYRHLFQPLPEELREDTAFLDRVHAYLPGWEMPVIAPK